MLQKVNRKYIFAVCILVLLDIGVKVIIQSFFMETKWLINDYLGFMPFLNQTQLSIFNNEMGLDISLSTLTVINFLIVIIAPFLMKRVEKREKLDKVLKLALFLIWIGAICSLIDKVFFGGSLDYLKVGSQIMDLKDIYLFTGIIIYFIMLIRIIISTKKNVKGNAE